MTLIKVHVNVFGREQRTVEVKKGSRIIDVLEKLSLNPVEIVVAKNREVVPEVCKKTSNRTFYCIFFNTHF